MKTNAPNNKSADELEEALLKFGIAVFGALDLKTDAGSDRRVDKALAKAKAQILTHYISRKEVLEAIGFDEGVSSNVYAPDIKPRNDLRAEIKEKLGLSKELIKKEVQ